MSKADKDTTNQNKKHQSKEKQELNNKGADKENKKIGPKDNENEKSPKKGDKEKVYKDEYDPCPHRVWTPKPGERDKSEPRGFGAPWYEPVRKKEDVDKEQAEKNKKKEDQAKKKRQKDYNERQNQKEEEKKKREEEEEKEAEEKKKKEEQRKETEKEKKKKRKEKWTKQAEERKKKKEEEKKEEENKVKEGKKEEKKEYPIEYDPCPHKVYNPAPGEKDIAEPKGVGSPWHVPVRRKMDLDREEAKRQEKDREKKKKELKKWQEDKREKERKEAEEREKTEKEEMKKQKLAEEKRVQKDKENLTKDDKRCEVMGCGVSESKTDINQELIWIMDFISDVDEGVRTRQGEKMRWRKEEMETEIECFRAKEAYTRDFKAFIKLLMEAEIRKTDKKLKQLIKMEERQRKELLQTMDPFTKMLMEEGNRFKHLYSAAMGTTPGKGEGEACELEDLAVCMIMNQMAHEPSVRAPDSAPMGFSGEPVSPTSVQLRWEPPAGEGPVACYKLFVVKADRPDWEATSVAVDSTEYIVDGLSKWTEYRFWVSAGTSGGDGPCSRPITLRTLEDSPDAPPSSVRAVLQGNTSIWVGWQQPPQDQCNGNIKYFKLYFCESDLTESDAVVKKLTNSTSFLINNFESGVEYRIWVLAGTEAGDGPPSKPLLISTGGKGVPGVPLNVRGHSTSPTSIQVAWDPPLKKRSSKEVTDYKIYFVKGEGSFSEAKGRNVNRTSVVLSGLKSGTDYCIWVAADFKGKEKLSKPIKITTNVEEPSIVEKASSHHIIGEPSEEPLSVENVFLYHAYNCCAHYTDKFKLDHPASPAIALRRGYPFNVGLKFKDGRDRRVNDVIELTFSYTVGNEERYRNMTWNWKEYYEDDTVVLQVQSPPDVPVGAWLFEVHTRLKHSNRRDKHTYKHVGEIFLLLNPWCQGDLVFMDSRKLLNEYVLSECGKVWDQPAEDGPGRPWLYGQFDTVILPVLKLLLYKSELPAKDLANPILLSRALAKMVNWEGDNGIVCGSLDSNSAAQAGTPHNAWTGSVPILEQYYESGEGVRFGQCLVSASVLTTLCRAIGIPSRPVTVFNPGTDKYLNLTVDINYGLEYPWLEETTDPLWNFHVWTEVWMVRPDLVGDFGGWQVIDGTPRMVKTEGKSQLGPAPVKAMYVGDLDLEFDTFLMTVIANADVYKWIADPQAPNGRHLIGKDTSRVGNLFITKKPNVTDYYSSKDREELAGHYKAEEGTEEERKNTNISLKKSRDIDEKDTKQSSDVVFRQGKLPIVQLGEPFEIVARAKNRSDSEKIVELFCKIGSKYYDGKQAYLIKESKVEFKLGPKSSLTDGSEYRVRVEPEEYLDKLVPDLIVKAVVLGCVRETGQKWADDDEFHISVPSISIMIDPLIQIFEDAVATVSFKNPFKKPLTNCKFLCEAPGISRFQEITPKDIAPEADVTLKVHFTPNCAGSFPLVVTFQSDEFVGGRGAAVINVV